MQPLTASPRSALTAAAVRTLLTSPHIIVSSGLELLDQSLNVLDNLSDDLLAGRVARSSYAQLHGTASLRVSRLLDWGQAIVRPLYTISNGVTTATFRLGAYYTSTPADDPEETPQTYDVECEDILAGLDDSVGDAYSVGAGESYLVRVEQILTQRGYTQYVIDQESAAVVLPTPRAWPFDENTTWLTIVNDLLGSIGYAGIYSDWDGRLRCEPYDPPRQRSSEWYFGTGVADTLLTARRRRTQDFARSPNRWVFFRSNNTDAPAPVEGDGIYTFVNESTGITSVDARGGRVITKPPVGVDVASQSALVARAQQTIDADMAIPATVALDVAPLPLLWHFDVVTYDDPAVSPVVDALVTSWALDLDGGDGSQEWTLLT